MRFKSIKNDFISFLVCFLLGGFGISSPLLYAALIQADLPLIYFDPGVNIILWALSIVSSVAVVSRVFCAVADVVIDF